MDPGPPRHPARAPCLYAEGRRLVRRLHRRAASEDSATCGRPSADRAERRTGGFVEPTARAHVTSHERQLGAHLEKRSHSRGQWLHRPSSEQVHPGTHRLAYLRHGSAVRAGRHAARQDPRFHFVEGDITINMEWVEYHVRKCDVILPLVAIATPATYVREPLARVRAGFRGEPAHHPPLRQIQEARGVPLDLRGLRREPRQGIRSRDLRARARSDPQAALDLFLRQAAARSHHLGLWRTGPAIHAVPALQLDRLGPRQHGRSEGGQLARADAVPRAHRARRAHQAGRRRQPDPRLHLHRRRGGMPDQDHRQSRRHRRRQDLQHRQSRTTCTRSGNSRR